MWNLIDSEYVYRLGWWGIDVLRYKNSAGCDFLEQERSTPMNMLPPNAVPKTINTRHFWKWIIVGRSHLSHYENEL